MIDHSWSFFLLVQVDQLSTWTFDDPLINIDKSPSNELSWSMLFSHEEFQVNLKQSAGCIMTRGLINLWSILINLDPPLSHWSVFSDACPTITLYVGAIVFWLCILCFDFCGKRQLPHLNVNKYRHEFFCFEITLFYTNKAWASLILYRQEWLLQIGYFRDISYS